MSLLEDVGNDLSALARLEKILKDSLRAPMAETLDVRLVEVAEGRVAFEAEPGAQHYNPMGTVASSFRRPCRGPKRYPTDSGLIPGS